jgi:DMSO/TMAO reductase YedYZ molybdopterin-dependent catalytic subunit
MGSIVLVKSSSNDLEEVEIREYQGEDLSSIHAFRENSIKGPQDVDIETYRLIVGGLVVNQTEFTYNETLTDFQSYKKVITLYCVEGWHATILWEGILLEDLLDITGIDPEATTVIFYAYDGYSTSLSLDYVLENHIMIAYKMNNVTLLPERGYPLTLVAESKWGYKWIKWITSIELSDNDEFRGFWENYGYAIDGSLDEPYLESTDPAIPEFPLWTIFPLLIVGTLVAIELRKKLKKSYIS